MRISYYFLSTIYTVTVFTPTLLITITTVTIASIIMQIYLKSNLLYDDD